jgi:hypothetical protein
MTQQERHEVKAMLIELGFWDASDPGDPTTDYQSSQTLHHILENHLAKDLFLSSANFIGDSSECRVELVQGPSSYTLATAANPPEAMWMAALALPEFLRQHPECASEEP